MGVDGLIHAKNGKLYDPNDGSEVTPDDWSEAQLGEEGPMKLSLYDHYVERKVQDDFAKAGGDSANVQTGGISSWYDESLDRGEPTIKLSAGKAVAMDSILADDADVQLRSKSRYDRTYNDTLESDYQRDQATVDWMHKVNKFDGLVHKGGKLYDPQSHAEVTPDDSELQLAFAFDHLPEREHRSLPASLTYKDG